MWLRNVPDELATSFTCHSPFSKVNSQCFRLTTLDLKPTGASEGAEGIVIGIPSRSEYLPTRIMASLLGRVREIGENVRDWREFLFS